jgi:hypothetical protein
MVSSDQADRGGASAGCRPLSSRDDDLRPEGDGTIPDPRFFAGFSAAGCGAGAVVAGRVAVGCCAEFAVGERNCERHRPAAKSRTSICCLFLGRRTVRLKAST